MQRKTKRKKLRAISCVLLKRGGRLTKFRLNLSSKHRLKNSLNDIAGGQKTGRTSDFQVVVNRNAPSSSWRHFKEKYQKLAS